MGSNDCRLAPVPVKISASKVNELISWRKYLELKQKTVPPRDETTSLDHIKVMEPQDVGSAEVIRYLRTLPVDRSMFDDIKSEDDEMLFNDQLRTALGVYCDNTRSKVEESEFYDQMFNGDLFDQTKAIDGTDTDNVSFLGNLNRLMSTLNKGIEVKHSLNKDSINDVSTKIDEKVDIVKKSMWNSLPGMDQVKKFTTPVAAIAFVIAAIQWYRQGKFAKELFYAAVTLMLPEAYSLAKPYLLRIWHALVKSSDADKKKSKKKKTKEEDSDEEKEEVYEDQIFEMPSITNFSLCPSTIKILSGAVAGLFLSWTIKNGRTLTETVDRVLRLKDFPNLSNGVYSVFEWFMTAIETLVNWIRGLFGADKWYFWSGNHADAEDAIREGYACCSKYNVKDRLTVDDVKYIDALSRKILHAESKLPKNATRELVLIAGLKRAMVPLEQRARRTNVMGAGSRIAPVSILFCGESGIGKSNAQIAFAKAICARLLPEERLKFFLKNPDIEIYSKNELDLFWEGYNGQFVTWHDDLGHMKTVIGQPSAETGLIPEINEVPYNLNIAFEGKGKVFFTSEVILGTTNFHKADLANLAYQAAYINRWHIVYIQCVRKEYCINPEVENPMKRQFDPSKCNLQDGVIEKWAHSEWIAYDMKGYHEAQNEANNTKRQSPLLRNFLGKSHTFDEVVEDFIDKYEARRTRSVDLIHHHGDVVKQQLEIRRSRPPRQYVVEQIDVEDGGKAPKIAVSNKTSVPGGLKDQSGESKADYLEFLKVEEARTKASTTELNRIINLSSIEKVEKDPLPFTVDETDFTVKIEYYGYVEKNGVQFRRAKSSVPDAITYRKLDGYRKYACYKVDTGAFTHYACDAHLELLASEGSNMDFYNCPVSSLNFALVPDGEMLNNVEDKRQFYRGYYNGIVADSNRAKEVLMGVPKSLMREYPSMSNVKFVLEAQSCNVGPYALGVLIAATSKLTICHSKRVCCRAKRAFSSYVYSVYGVAKDNVKKLCSGSWLKDALMEGMKYALIAVAALVAGGYLIKAGTGAGILPVFTPTEESNEDQSNKVHNVKGMKEARRKDKIVSKMTNQAGFQKYYPIHDPQLDSILTRIRNRNIMLIYYPGGALCGSCVIVNEYIAIAPRHYRDRMMEKVSQGLITENSPLDVIPWNSKKNGEEWYGAFKFIPSEKNMTLPRGNLRNMDVCLIDFRGSGMQPKSPMVKYFYRESDLCEEASHYRGTLMKVSAPGQVEKENCDLTISGGVVTDSGKRLNKWQWNYIGHGTTGTCGSLIAIHDVNSKGRKVVGFHTSGGAGGKSAGAVVFQEDVEFELNVLGVEYSVDRDGDACFADESGDIPHRPLWKEASLPMPVFNQMVKSPLNGLLSPVTKIPTKLTPWVREDGVKLDPLMLALGKQVPRSVYINSDLVNIIVHESFKHCMRVSPIETRGPGRIYSIEEACSGIPGDPYVKGIPRTTSAGHPWNIEAMKVGGGKYLWFGRDDQYDFTNSFFKKLKARCLWIYHRALEGHRCTFIAYVFGKQEALSIEKVRDGKLRLIFGFPQDHSIVGRSLNMECFKWIMMNRIENWFSIGINEKSQEWDILGKKLEGGKLIDGDEKNYDGRNKRIFINAMTQFNNLYYNDDNTRAREIIDLELGNCKCILNGSVYERVDGLGSGAYPTIFSNSHSHKTSIPYAVHKIMFGTGQVQDSQMSRELLFRFFNECYCIIQGDDFVLRVNGIFIDRVTFHTLKEALADIGYELTPARKDNANPGPYVEHSEVTFLKRRFVKHDGRYIAPLDPESIDGMVQWCNKKNYKLDHFYLVIETYLEEYALHGREVFESKYSKLIKTMQELSMTYVPKYNTWEEYFNAALAEDTNTVNDLWDAHNNVAAADWNGRQEEYVGHVVDDEILEDRMRELFRDQAGGDDRDDIASGSASDEKKSATIKQATTVMHTDHDDDFVLENASLEDKLRRISVRQNDVRDFFAKKVEIGTSTWSTTNGIGDVLTNYDIDALFAANTMWTNKKIGFLNFRGTAVITLQMAATPFHSGAIRVYWQPWVANDPDWGLISRMHTYDVISTSQLPGVIHRVSSDSVTFRCPIIGPQNTKTFDSSTTIWNYGFVTLAVYAPLRAAAADSLLVRAFLSFEDAEIDTPFFNQAGDPEEDEKKEQGIITRSSGVALRVAEALDGIPTLQPITGPARWLLSRINGAASAMGWSKPNISEGLGRVTSNMMYYGPNSDGTDASVTIGNRADNRVTTMARASIYPQDEMSINFIKRQWSYLTQFTMTTSGTIGTQLYGLPHRPSAYCHTTVLPKIVGQYTAFFFTPIAYLSNLFDNWCGDVELKFVFCKTGFHSGTLSFAYLPTRGTPGLTYANLAYVLREVVDIQQCDEFCFTMPYSVPDPYLPFLTPAGALSVDIVTPLKAPSTVSSTIDVMVFVRGAPNLDFQVPREKYPYAIYYDQGGDMDNDGCIDEGVIANAMEAKFDVAKQAYCVGESITSLKQLISKYRYIVPNLTDTDWTGFKTLYIPPLLVGLQQMALDGGGKYSLSGESPWLTDYISSIACCYLFQRGSMRYCFSSDSAALMGTISDYIPANTTPTAALATTNDSIVAQASNTFTSSGLFMNSDNETSLVMRDPYYNKYPVTLVRPTYHDGQTFNVRYGPNHSISVSSNTTLNFTSGNFFMQRAAGEDYQLSFWLGVPVMFVP